MTPLGKDANMNRMFAAIAAVASVAALSAGVAAGSGSQDQITIRHQVRGCHTWSYDGGLFAAALVVKLKAGSTLTVTNVDMMPHRLLRTAGPKVQYTGNPLMNHLGAQLQIKFLRAGVYRFTTRPGEDYTPMKTVGEDNSLTLQVAVL